MMTVKDDDNSTLKCRGKFSTTLIEDSKEGDVERERKT